MIRKNSQKEIYPARFYTQVVGRFIHRLECIQCVQGAGANGLVWFGFHFSHLLDGKERKAMRH